LLEIFVKEQCFEKKCFDNKTWKEFSLAMDRPMFLNMSKTFCNLETRNMKFNRCFFKCFHWVMLAFWQIDMCKDWKKSAQCYTKCVWFSKSLSQIYPCCNKFQLNLFLFQRFDIMFILSISPKVGICSKRNNLHISSFLRFATVLWIIDKHCNKL